MSNAACVCGVGRPACELNLPLPPPGCCIRGPLDPDIWDKIFIQLQELHLCSKHLSTRDRDALCRRLPASACSLDHGPKLFFKCL